MAASSGSACSSELHDSDDELPGPLEDIGDPKRVGLEGIGGKLLGRFMNLGAESVLEELYVIMYGGALDDKSATILAESSLTKNGTLKILNLAGTAGITRSAAAILGKMLEENSTLEVLNLWDSVSGGEVLEYLLKPLMKNDAGQQPNSSLKRLHISGGGIFNKGPSGAAMLGKMLAENSTLEELGIVDTVLGGEDLEYLLKPLMKNEAGQQPSSSLKRLHISGSVMFNEGPSEAAMLGKMLAENSTLEELDIVDTVLGGEDLEYLLQPLMKNEAGQQPNTSLKRLHIRRSGMVNKGPCAGAMLGKMLAENSTLEDLDLWGTVLGGEDLEYFLKPLMWNEARQQPNSSLKRLCFSWCDKGSRGAAVVAETLCKNHTLMSFSMQHVHLGPEDWCKILKSLEGNTSLEELDIRSCNGLGSNEVQAVFMDLVGKFNHTLSRVYLSCTDVMDEYAIQSQVKRNRQVASAYKDWMKELNTIPPMFARVFLCGNTLAGKSTLRTSMIRSLVKKPRKRVGLKIQARVEAMRDNLRSVKDPEEWAGRTRGIKIKVLSNDGECLVSLWDLAGQEEYQAFHDFMIPDFSDGGSCSSFVLLCSPFVKLSDEEKDICDIEEELCHWMKFIASNTRRSIIARPHVIVVITRMDKGYEHIETIKRVVGKLRSKFEDFIEVSAEVHFLCARSYDSKEVEKLVTVIKSTCAEQLQRLPKVYEACARMQKDVLEWNEGHPEEPLIDQKTFSDITKYSLGFPSILCGRGDQENEKIEEIWSAVACSLHDAGEIVYFKDERFVVVNPGWFCHEVMGQIIELPKFIDGKRSASSEFKEGFVEKAELEVLLRKSLKKTPTMQKWCSSLTSELIGSLIQLMVRLKLCYEVGLEREKVFIPVTLIDDDAKRIAKGERKLEFEMDLCDASYLGRRLQCLEPGLTALTPGFFPKLQVELHNYFAEELPKELAVEARFYNRKNLMRIIFAELEILVELSGETMAVSFIDILVQSSKPKSHTLEFVEKHVVCKIVELCYSAGGCQGVSLQEAILQTKCVEALLPLKHRINQVVLVETLKERFEGDPDYKHLWEEVKEGDEVVFEWDCESAWVLLGEKVCKQILRWKQRGLDVGVLTDDSFGPAVNSKSGSVLQLSSDLRKLSAATSSKANRQGQIIDPMLGWEVVKKLDMLLEFTIGIRERQCPCYVYFTDPKVAHKLMVKLLPQHIALRLHFLCEHVDACHVVDEQEGVAVNFAPEEVKKIVGPLILGTFASVTCALKVSAHLAGGMGNLVPNIGSGVALKYASHTVLDYFRKEVSSTPANAQNKRGAEQWLVDFVKDKSMINDFGLVRVRYLEDNKIRWVCRYHRDQGYKRNTLLEIPISERT